MPLSQSQKARRAQERQKVALERETRIQLLEDTLHQAWLWLSTDSDNPEALRQILLRADLNNQIHAALDRLIKEPR